MGPYHGVHKLSRPFHAHYRLMSSSSTLSTTPPMPLHSQAPPLHENCSPDSAYSSPQSWSEPRAIMSMSPIHEHSGPPGDHDGGTPAAFYNDYHHHGYYHHQHHHQNSPYFPAAAAIYHTSHQSYHHYHSHEAVAVPSDYSPGSEASNSDYFYAASATSAVVANPAGASGYGQSGPSSSFSFDSGESR